tara:strand:+ start:481 stop:687 length:207 start_codon:yes stop_codon:yes gene_type:complete
MTRDTSLTRLDILKQRHQELDDKADKMSSKGYLSPAEQLHLRELKVMRLRCRDAISSLEAEEKESESA